MLQWNYLMLKCRSRCVGLASVTRSAKIFEVFLEHSKLWLIQGISSQNTQTVIINLALRDEGRTDRVWCKKTGKMFCDRMILLLVTICIFGHFLLQTLVTICNNEFLKRSILPISNQLKIYYVIIFLSRLMINLFMCGLLVY